MLDRRRSVNPERVSITKHALLRYADRCYGEAYKFREDIPGPRAELFEREMCEHILRGVRLTAEQARQFNSLWPLPRKDLSDQSGALYYQDDVLLVADESSAGRTVITVFGAAPAQLRYLEEIGVRRRAGCASPKASDWLGTDSHLEIMFVNRIADGGIDVPPEHIATWLDRPEKKPGRRFFVEGALRPFISGNLKRFRCRPLQDRRSSESIEAWRHWKHRLMYGDRCIRILCSPQRAVIFLQECIYDLDALPADLLTAPIVAGTVLGFDPTEQGTYTFRVLHVPSEP